jgi:hypothetical protein
MNRCRDRCPELLLAQEEKNDNFLEAPALAQKSEEFAATQACQRIMVATGSYIGDASTSLASIHSFTQMPISRRGTLQ